MARENWQDREVRAQERVVVAVRNNDDHVLLEVRDQGEGIAADEREHIFEPFYSTKSKGSGLGLAIAKQLSTAQGWEIRLLRREGGGTDACVILPR